MTAKSIDNHLDPQICRQCRGLCCQGHPGVWVDPTRFLLAFGLPRPASEEDLRRRLPREVVLRNVDGVAIPAPLKLEGGCVFLESATGCRLPVNKRPGQCLALVPSIDTLIDEEIHCRLLPEGSTLAALKNWQVFWAGLCTELLPGSIPLYKR
jgi:Fe-S-cluster containining protein